MIKELAKKNRSYRGYDHSVKVTKEQLLDWIDTARYCASSVNLQPLKFYYSCEDADNEKFRKEVKYARKLAHLNLPYPGTEPTAYILIAVDKSIAPNTQRFARDIGIVAQTMLLQAVEEGLGGIMIGNFDPEALKRSLDLPETIEPNLVVAFGKPAEDIILTDVKEDGNIDYYRDEEGRHYVPKRSLREIVLNQE